MPGRYLKGTNVRHQPGRKRVHCIICGLHVDVCGPLSRRYRCSKCGTSRVIDNMRDLHYREGEGYERWLSSMRRALARLGQGE